MARAPRRSSPVAPALAPAAVAAAGALGRGALGLGRAVAWAVGQPDVQRVVALAALAAGLLWSTAAAEARVAAWPRFAVSRAALATSPLPDGLSPRAREDLAGLPVPEGASGQDPRLVPALHAALADLPWVARVEAVRLEADGALSFAVVARTPAARVEAGAERGLVTRDGSVIPLAYGAAPEALPRLDGVPPPPPAGAAPAAWAPRRRAIEACLGVLDDLGPLAARVRAVDVSNLGGRRDPLASEVTLLVDDDLVVDWGRAPDPAPAAGAEDGPAVGRPSTDAAARRTALAAFLEGGPARSSVARVSVRWDEVTFVQRPSPAPATPTALAGR